MLQDFLRQNNTGKLLWQVFGTEAATLCLFGISEHEEIMWNALKLAGLFDFLPSSKKFKTDAAYKCQVDHPNVINALLL